MSDRRTLPPDCPVFLPSGLSGHIAAEDPACKGSYWVVIADDAPGIDGVPKTAMVPGDQLRVDIATIRARWDAATPGPWKWEFGAKAYHRQQLWSTSTFGEVISHWVGEDQAMAVGDPDAAAIAFAPTDIAALLYELDRLGSDAKRWVALRAAAHEACMMMGRAIPRADEDLILMAGHALFFTASALQARADGGDWPLLVWRKDNAGWGLIVILPQGISSLGDVMRYDALQEWRWAIHEPFDNGYVNSPQEALVEMRKRLPGWKIPDMPAELLKWEQNHPSEQSKSPQKRSSSPEKFHNLIWMPTTTGGFDLVCDVFGGITIGTIAVEVQLGPNLAPLRWTAEGRPPQAGSAWSFTEALKAIRHALPACAIPDLPAGVK